MVEKARGYPGRKLDACQNPVIILDKSLDAISGFVKRTFDQE